jgi:DNA-directed RNA polymerase specialized sigma24 family protein
MKRQPLLEEVRIMLEAAMYHHKEGNTEDAEELTNDALENVYEAIHQIQGAREDAFRMAGRVTLDTELLDMLAPKEGN